MKVGDLVIRKTSSRKRNFAWQAAKKQRAELGAGIILSKQRGGSNPCHPCITVLYPKVGKVYDIAESLMKVVSKKEE